VGVQALGQTRYRKYAETDPETGQPHGFATPTGKLEIYSTSFAEAGRAPQPRNNRRYGAFLGRFATSWSSFMVA
jgi:hypothetical protein